MAAAQQTTPESFITSLPTQVSFITSLPTAPADASSTVAISTQSEDAGTTTAATLPFPVSQGKTAAPTAQFGTTLSQQSGGTSTSAGVIAGVVVLVVSLAIGGIALWFFCLRKRFRRRNKVVSYSGGSHVNSMYSRATPAILRPKPPTTQRSPFGQKAYPALRPLSNGAALPALPSPTWQQRSSSIRTVTTRPGSAHTTTTAASGWRDRSSLAETDAGTWPEPLSPRPARQQTIHKLTVPRPVDASSFRPCRNDSQSSVSSSGSPSTPGNPQPEGPSQGKPLSWVAPYPEPGTPKFSLGRVAEKGGLVGLKAVPARPEMPIVTQIKAAEPDGSLRGTVKSESDKGARHLSTRKSPLAQNPFNDPGHGKNDQESESESESDSDSQSELDSEDEKEESVRVSVIRDGHSPALGSP